MADVFHQVYSPVSGSILLSALIASLPPLLLAVLLAGIRVAPWRAAIAAAATASVLAGLGFEPIMAASLALIANTAPVAFGSLGIPVTTLGGLLAPMLGHDAQTTTRALSAMVGRQLPVFSLAIPAYLVILYAG